MKTAETTAGATVAAANTHEERACLVRDARSDPAPGRSKSRRTS